MFPAARVYCRSIRERMLLRCAAFALLAGMGATDQLSVCAQESKLRLPAPFNGVYEGEYHFKREGTSRVQGMRGFGTDWSRDSHLLWDGKIGDACNLKFSVRATSRYRILLQLTKAGDYGNFHVSIP